MALIKVGGEVIEGQIFNKYLRSRMIEKNKSVLLTTTGSTGSGKSYINLRVAELWYKDQFDKPFPISHVCFSVEDVVTLLHSGDLRKGDLLIMEEGGVLMNSLDFQAKISKLFSFILQSFRSMNLCLMINLPHLQMLNKTARMLTHVNFVTCGVDYSTKTSKVKPFFHQVNQTTGKIYPKYPKVNRNGSITQCKRFNYQIPSKELVNLYEIQKKKFVADLIEDFKERIDAEKSKEAIKMGRKELTDNQKEVQELSLQGLNQNEIAAKLGKSQPAVWDILQRIKKKLYKVGIERKSLRK